jgi:hypothetical protein
VAAWISGNDSLEYDNELGWQLQRQRNSLPRRQFDRVDDDLVDDVFKVVFGQIDPGAPEDLPLVLPHRQRVRVVRRDPAYARVHREGNLDHLIQCVLVTCTAERTAVTVGMDRLEGGVGVEHAATTGAKYIPGEIE